MTDEKLFDKLRKLKRLAEDGKNDAECQAALLAFQRLLTKNNLSEADVNLSDVAPKETVEEVIVHQGGRIYDWIKIIHSTIAENFRCIGTITHNKLLHEASLEFYGHTTDVLIASRTFEAAINAAYRLAKECEARFLADSVLNDMPYSFDRFHYLKGFAIGLDEAYKRARRNDGELALIIQTPQDVRDAVDKIADGKHNIRMGIDPFEYDDSFMSGYDDGENVGAGNRIGKEA
ncbi:MAG: DUF2786 domain-containing protein [Clostridia bacterium]|nr:DUF2786 domain-containing protein [Clostridia bacterium]